MTVTTAPVRPAIAASAAPLRVALKGFTTSGSSLILLEDYSTGEFVLIRTSSAMLNYTDRHGVEDRRVEPVRFSRHTDARVVRHPDTGDAHLICDGRAYYQSTALMWAMDFTHRQEFRDTPHHPVVEDARQYCREAPRPLQEWVDAEWEAHDAAERSARYTAVQVRRYEEARA